MTIYDAISSLVNYGLNCEFFEKEDKIYMINKYLAIFKLDDFKEGKDDYLIGEVMDYLINYASKNLDISLDSLNERDNFDAYLMDVMLPKPSEVSSKINSLYQRLPQLATLYFYDLSVTSRYVRVDRLRNNISFKDKVNNREYDITINLSKPEKDPKEIARLRNVKSTSYPQCALCKENEGFYGTLSKAGRSNLRIFPLTINNEQFYLQYSPYGYFNEHCILLKDDHSNMKISLDTFKRLTDFVTIFPQYFIGSNADLPIVGGSMLFHEHYQGGQYEFASFKAPLKYEFTLKGFKDVKLGIVDWPISTIRLASDSKLQAVLVANHIFNVWKTYSDESLDIIANDGEEHNTITPIVRKKENKYIIDIMLRNNRTSKEHELGIFHPHKEVHHIKKENIGLIEAMGMAILPGRLKKELKLVKETLLENKDVSEEIKIHEDWINHIKQTYNNINKDTVDEILKHELGLTFDQILKDAGVFKETKEGFDGFKRFIEKL